MWDYTTLAHPLPDMEAADVPPEIYRDPPVHRTDNRYRQLLLPYQARYDAGRLRGRGVDHFVPNGTGTYTGVAGGGLRGAPAYLAPVPTFVVAPNGTLVRAGRVATSNPSQYTTPAAFDNGVLYSRAEPIRWPDA